WWKKARSANPRLLDMTAEDLAGPAANQVSSEDYPMTCGEVPLSYEFAPGEADDRVTADLALTSLFDGNGVDLSWLGAGLALGLGTELIRGLPKDLRRVFVPVPDTAREVLARLGEPRGDLLDALSTELTRIGGVRIPRSAWALDNLPPHLRVSYR